MFQCFDKFKWFNFLLSGAIVITIFRLAKRKDVKEILDVLYNTFKRDATAFLLVLRFVILIKYEEFKGSTVISLFSRMVHRYPNKVILESENKTWTFKQVNALFNHSKLNHFYEKLMCENIISRSQTLFLTAGWLQWSDSITLSVTVKFRKRRYSCYLHVEQPWIYRNLAWFGKNWLSWSANKSKFKA